MCWRWRCLLIVPLLASAHACDCGGGGGDSGGGGCGQASCGPILPCGLLGQCASDAGTCPKGFRPDPSTSCGSGGGFCCTVAPPACADLGGVCQAIPGIAVSDICPQGTIDGDCGDAGVCCIPPGGDAGSSDGGLQVLDAPSTDAEDARDTAVIGSCNDAPCARGCTCLPFSPDASPVSPDAALSDAAASSDAGGGMCVCAFADASADAEGLEDADAADAGASGESAGAQMNDAAEVGDAMTPADSSVKANAAGPCGVILCASTCVCTSPAASACVCP